MPSGTFYKSLSKTTVQNLFHIAMSGCFTLIEIVCCLHIYTNKHISYPDHFYESKVFFCTFCRSFPDHFDESKLFQGIKEEVNQLKVRFILSKLGASVQYFVVFLPNYHGWDRTWLFNCKVYALTNIN